MFLFLPFIGNEIPATSDDSRDDDMREHLRPNTTLSNVSKLEYCSTDTRHDTDNYMLIDTLS